MHQAILEAPSASRGVSAPAPLRFIRSSSVRAAAAGHESSWSETFGAPVDRGLRDDRGRPPDGQQPAAAAAAEARLGGHALPGPRSRSWTTTGACSPRGGRARSSSAAPTSRPGYENNPEANATAFTNGWFRTGDQGYFDDDGYLSLTGRIKEIINRGGEKIAPREVDEVLMEHPAVAQAVTFAVPHPRLGEDVGGGRGAARRARRRPSASCGASSRASLADFKVPRILVFLDEMPKGPTGKLQRIGLAERLGLVPGPSAEAAAGRGRIPPHGPRSSVWWHSSGAMCSRSNAWGLTSHSSSSEATRCWPPSWYRASARRYESRCRSARYWMLRRWRSRLVS